MMLPHHPRLQSGSDDTNTGYTASFMLKILGFPPVWLQWRAGLNDVDLGLVLIETRLLERHRKPASQHGTTKGQADRIPMVEDSSRLKGLIMA